MLVLVVVVVVATYNMQTIMMVPAFINWCNQPRFPAAGWRWFKNPGDGWTLCWTRSYSLAPGLCCTDAILAAKHPRKDGYRK